MSNEIEKEVDDMPIWQNHEQRITALEVNMRGLSKQMDSVESTVRKANNEQKELLNTINNRMVDEFFHKKRTTHDHKWQLAGKITAGLFGAGGIIYLLFDLTNKFIGW